MYFSLLSHKWFLQSQLPALSVAGVVMFPTLGQSWSMTRFCQDGHIPISTLNPEHSKWDIPKRT